LQEAGTLAADVGDAVGLAYARELLGLVAARLGDEEEATAHWAEAQLRYEQLHDDDGQARCLLHRATVLMAADPARARELLTDSVALRGDRPGVGAALAHARLAELTRDGRTWERHRQLAREALAPWQDRLEQPEEVTALLEDLTN
ncbi:MAG TPA: hypothetical protein VLM05_10880, partial [Mycobacteriales bacterium]|nr:hypothetical protein [Mycobacteriales bacterium]